MTGMIDFTNCKKILGRAYNGANGKKIAVEYNGKEYMLKFPPSGATKPTELSYTNSCISEHIASSIFNMIGIRAQETLLGTYEVSGKTKVVCACRDFTEKGYRLFDFCSIKNTILDSDSGGSGTELADIMDTIEKQQYVEPSFLMQHFWNVFVVDALLGNFDRHNGNWGFLYNDSTGEASVAPVYDCGSCLLPQADEKIMEQALSNADVMNARIYQFPTSAIKLDGRKINYYDFLMSEREPECNAAIQRTAIIQHITYNVLEDTYDTDIFTDAAIKGKLDVNAMKADKHLFDHIVYDSMNERKFAQELDASSEVAVYVKLPDGFYISTPVGHYNPDWAIAFKEGSVKHIYFVAETKGSMDTLELREIEDAKIHCAREHFKAISGENVVYDVVDSYDTLLRKVMK